MARFDVYRQGRASGHLLDCQADVLHMLNTRFVVPLLSPQQGPRPISRLNPEFRVGDDEVIMYTQFAAAVPTVSLKTCICSLGHEDTRIMNALDVLLTGH